MLIRALVVLLAVLNLGVAVWWMARRERMDAAPSATPTAGAQTLRLVREMPKDWQPKPAPAAMPAPAANTDAAPPDPVADATETVAPTDDAPPAAAERCFALGPFVDANALASARSALQSRALRLHQREAAAPSARGWRVVLPPQADRDAAQALAARISAAGFDDFFIVASGADANAIALGRYGSESAARQRESALRAAGFADARAQPLDGAPAQSWIDVAVAAATPPATLTDAAGATAARIIDCGTVR